jgi:hypothetical protein
MRPCARPLRGRMLPLPPRRAARASRPRHPRLTPTRLPRCRRSQRRRSAVAAPSQSAAEGRRAARAGRNGRRTLAQAVGAGRGASVARSAACVGRAQRSRLPARPLEGRFTGAVCAPACGLAARSHGCEIDAVRSVWRPRDSSGRPVGGLAVADGHVGADQSGGGVRVVHRVVAARPRESCTYPI